jgi:hypothetical protein
MNKEDRQKLAAMEREILERKFGPLEEAEPLPQNVIEAYETAEAAIQRYRELALKACEGQPDYCRRELENLTSMSSMSLEESLGYIRD